MKTVKFSLNELMSEIDESFIEEVYFHDCNKILKKYSKQKIRQNVFCKTASKHKPLKFTYRTAIIVTVVSVFLCMPVYAAISHLLPNCGFVLSYNSTPTSKTTLPRALEKLANLAGVHRIKIHALRHSHASLLISMGENPLLIKERLGHEKIQTTLGTYGHLYPNTNIEIAKKLTGVLSYQSASQSIANYTSNQHTAMYHKEI